MIATALAALMILSVAYMAIAFVISASAADSLEAYAFDTVKTDDDFRLAIGIRYGSSAFPVHPLTTPYGYVVGEARVTRTDHDFTPLYVLSETDIAAVVDANLTVGYQTCSIATSEEDTDIGGYHVELTLEVGNIWDNLNDLSSLFTANYEQVFPAYINGVNTIRVGSYANYTDASAAAAEIGAKLEGFNVSVASPSSSGMSFINGDYDTILFEYAGDQYCYGGVCALQVDGQEEAFIRNNDNTYIYGGVFCFPRYITDEYNGLTLINLVELTPYVEGILPNEISNTWPREALQAFAIMARTVAMSALNTHFSKYGFDLCVTHCQAYRGRRLVNDKVIEACESTDNLIMTYGDKITSISYSSSQGGCSAGSEYVWVAPLPYLINQATPWEDYADVYRGNWTFETTPEYLAEAFRDLGCSQITGSRIESLSFETVGAPSTYVYSMTATDELGNTGTVTKCQNIASLMHECCYSANFVINRGEVTYTYTDVLSNRIIDLKDAFSGELSVYTENGIAQASSSKFNFFTALGQALSNSSSALYVHTEKGTSILTSELDLPVSTTPDLEGKYTVVSDYGDFLIVSELQDYMETHTASSPDNYAIAGKGWGHGVGASQYGIYHLAKAGASYEQIIKAYFPGTEISYLTDYLKSLQKN